MNVQGSVQKWECKQGVQFFLFVIEIEQSQTIKSYVLNMSLQLTDHKCLREK